MIKQGRVSGSLRDEGFVTIAVSFPTRSMIRQLAGREALPVSDYLKALARRELGDDAPALPGQEREVSKATLPALNIKMDAVLDMLSRADRLDDAFVRLLGITGVWRKDAPHIVLAEAVRAVVDKARALPTLGVTQGELADAIRQLVDKARSLPTTDSSQGELRLA